MITYRYSDKSYLGNICEGKRLWVLEDNKPNMNVQHNAVSKKKPPNHSILRGLCSGFSFKSKGVMLCLINALQRAHLE